MWHSCLKRAFLTSWKCNRSWWRINHYTGADCAAPAVDYWQKAGQRASERSANQEAISHLSKGLEFLGIVPGTPVRLQQELDLQVAFGSVLMVTKGFGAPDVEQAYARARELCQQVGDTVQLFPVPRGLSLYYQLRGQLQTPGN
ncbi:hypothetical protein C2W62_33945 [Candidatus Entotheonella serta]|nr:hypothetical protein C2W62_33945 [Candidatus Entotheonella serta]